MKKILLLILVLVVLVNVGILVNNRPEAIISRIQRQGGLKEGTLKYRVRFFGVLAVGEALFFEPKLEDFNKHKALHLSAKARSLQRFSLIFTGGAKLDSFINPQTFCPYSFKQKISVSGKDDYVKEVIYDQEKGVLTIANVERDMPKGTHDALSTLYSIRMMDLEKVKNFDLNLNTNQKNYSLKAKVKPVVFTVDKKEFAGNAIEANIARREKSSYHKSSISMVTIKNKDGQNIPIYIRVFASGAIIIATLEEVK